jgi:hypothetical protein
MYHLRPNIILQNALSAELKILISSFATDKTELDEIIKECTEITTKELFVDSTYYSEKLKDLQELYLSKRMEYIQRFEILKVITQQAIYLN